MRSNVIKIALSAIALSLSLAACGTPEGAPAAEEPPATIATPSAAASTEQGVAESSAPAPDVVCPKIIKGKDGCFKMCHMTVYGACGCTAWICP